MRKDEFHESSKAKTQGDKGSGSITTLVQPRPQMAPGLSPPAPKPPFGMPVMPVARSIKIMPPVIVTKADPAPVPPAEKDTAEEFEDT